MVVLCFFLAYDLYFTWTVPVKMPFFFFFNDTAAVFLIAKFWDLDHLYYRKPIFLPRLQT